jgi:glycosyltransferase involved in cell wall biosynthesis
MKVVHLLPLFSPRARGGMEIFCTSLAKAQSRLGDGVHILCPNVVQGTAREDLDGIPMLRFPFPYGLRDRAFLAGLSRHPTCAVFHDAVEEIGPDIIHLHGLYPYMLPYLDGIGHSSRRKMVLTVHLVNVLCPRQTLVDHRGNYCDGRVDFGRCARCVGSGEGVATLKAVVNQMLLPVSSVLAKASFGAELLGLVPAHGRVEAQIRALGFMKAHCFMDLLNPWFQDVFLRNGFPESQVGYFRNASMDPLTFVGARTNGLLGSRLRLLYVGRLSKDKGIDTLLGALRGLEDKTQLFSLRLVGRCVDSDVDATIHELVRKGYDITLVGEVSHDATHAHYAESDFLLFPSLPGSGDMLPLVIQEAFEKELSVIASDTPPSRALVREGLNGYLFKAGDVADLARVLRNVIETGLVLKFQYRPKVGVQPAKVEYYQQLYEHIVGSPHEPP